MFVCIKLNVYSKSYIDDRIRILNYYSTNYDSLLSSSNYADTLLNLRKEMDLLAYTDYHEEFNRISFSYNREIDSIVSLLDTKDSIVRQNNLKKLYIKSVNYPIQCFFIRQKSKEIISICSDYHSNPESLNLLSVIDLTSNLKDSVLKYSKTIPSREIMARLGDTIAENEIISDFKNVIRNIKNSSDLQRLHTICSEMLFANTDKCIKTYISYFDWNQIVDITKNPDEKAFTTIIAELLFYYGEYQPDCFELSNINVLYHSCPAIKRRCCVFEPTPFEADLFREIESFCQSKYNVTLHIDLPFLELVDSYYYIKDMELENELVTLLDRYKGRQ